MKGVKITENNLEEYRDLLPPDIAESIGRTYYRGLAVGGSPPSAAMVWEVLGTEAEDQATTSELRWLYRQDDDSGQELLEEYRNAAGEDEVSRSLYEFPVEEELEDLMTDSGFSAEEREGRNLVVTVGELDALSISKGKIPAHVIGLGELMVRQYRRGIMDCLFHKHKGALEDIAQLPMSYFDEEISSCVITDNKVCGFLLVHRLPSGPIAVNYMCAFEPEMRLNLALMIRRSVRVAVKNCKADTRVILPRHNDVTMKLVAKLFPDKKGEKVIAGERMEG